MTLSPFLKKVFANTSWLLSDKVIAMAANLLVSLALARSLGPTGFGELSYLLALIAMVMPLAALGLNAIVTRELVNQPDAESRVIATATGFRLFGALAGTLVCLLLAVTGVGLGDFESAKQAQHALALLAFANLFNALAVLEFWFQAHLQAKFVVRMRLLTTIAFALFKLLAVWFNAELVTVIAIFALETICLGLGYVIIYRMRAGGINLQDFDFSYGVKLIKQSFWLVLSGIAAVIYLKVDQLMLQHLATTAEVGTYAVAARLSEVWYFFADAIVISLFPAIIKLGKQANTQLYWHRLQQVSDGLFFVAVAIAVSVSLLAKPVIVLLFGVEYFPSVQILQIHIWAGIFVFMRALVSKWLLAEDLLPFSLVSHGFGAIINVAANWVLIPIWGGEGAAIATLISYFIASYLAFWLSPKTRPIAKVMSRSILLPFTLGHRYWSKSALTKRS